MSHKNSVNTQGQMLIELLLTIGLSALIFPALFTAFIATRSGRAQQGQRLQAVSVLEATEKEVKKIRNSDWTNISSVTMGIAYHPTLSGNNWTLASGATTTNGFSQQIVFSSVYRNSSGAIVSSGGQVDPSTIQGVITISWTQPYTSSIISTVYFTRTENLTWTQTTSSDFNQGTTTNTTVTNTSGGEVTLSDIANADWCKPQNFVVNQVNIPKLSNAIYALQGGAYLGSGDGTSNSPAFINVGISTPQPPASPSASILGTFNGAFTTNAIYSDGHYVYLATTNNPQVLILDVSHTPYTQVGTVTIPGGSPANSVYLSGNILFTTSGNNLYTFDVTTKTGAHTTVKSSVGMVAGIWTQPTARQVVVANNRAYVGTGNSLLGLQSFSFNSDGSNLQFQAAALLTFSQQSQGLFVDSTGHYAYMAFNNASGISFTKGLVVIDLTKTSWFFITFYSTSYTYNTGGMDPRGVTVPTNNRAIVVGVGGGSSPGTEQYQVVDTSSLSNPSPNLTYCGGFPITSGVYGVSSILDQYSTAYSYIITGESGNQFKIIRGGVGGGGYAPSGTFESSTLDANYSSAFNRFVATINQPAQTTIQLQVGAANAVNNSCSGLTFTYLGPDSTPNTYFSPSSGTISGLIPLTTYNPSYQNPSRCFRYKAYLTSSNSTTTPTLYDMTVNYSP